MIVKLDLENHECVVTKEKGDPYFSNSGYSDAESRFLHHVKLKLIEQGYDVIKKRMWKDGHMVDDTQQYIRTRKTKAVPFFYIYNANYALFDLGRYFNAHDEIYLRVEVE